MTESLMRSKWDDRLLSQNEALFNMIMTYPNQTRDLSHFAILWNYFPLHSFFYLRIVLVHNNILIIGI